MRPTAQLLEDIFQEIGLSDKEIRLRKEFLDFTETDVHHAGACACLTGDAQIRIRRRLLRASA